MPGLQGKGISYPDLGLEHSQLGPEGAWSRVEWDGWGGTREQGETLAARRKQPRGSTIFSSTWHLAPAVLTYS